MHRFIFCLLVTISCYRISFSQNYQPFAQVRTYTNQQSPNKYDSSFRVLTNRLGNELHYLYPLYQAIGWSDKFIRLMGNEQYESSLSQFLSFAGDYKMALDYSIKKYDTLPAKAERDIVNQVWGLKNIQYTPAVQSIMDNASSYEAVMINESPAKPQHRAFTYSLLAGLRKKGFNYLALETLGYHWNSTFDTINANTGFYSSEPVGAELVRQAITLGYTLVPYDDTLASKHTASQKDSIQAANLYAIFQRDKNAKVLVLGSYHHICEEKLNDQFIPMGYWFKKMSGLNPFTIDQTDMTEGSNFSYGKAFYDYFTKRFIISTPSIITYNNRLYKPMEEKGFDVMIVHPPTVYRNRRPSWLSLGGERQPVMIQPTEKKLFLVQAYYENEYSEAGVNQRVPADQTYISDNDGYYYLFLKKGKYRIVMRDIGYKVLSAKELVVD